VAFGDRPAPEAAPVNSQPPDSTTPPSQPAAQNNASATPPPQQISQNQDSEKPLETTQQIESRYGDGYRAYKFGMTPTEVARAANMNVNTDWGTLPVASEYKNVEVRYFFQYLNRVEDVSKINGGRFSNTSYICYFFEDGKLFKASLRFMNSQEYPNHQSIFLLMAREMGATIQQYQNSSVFRTDTSKVKIHGKMDASATIVNFIKSGSPMTDAD
jgi:hypothetical protein